MASWVHRLRWILVVVVGLALLALEPASAFPAGLDLHGIMDETTVGKDDAVPCNWLDGRDLPIDAWQAPLPAPAGGEPPSLAP